MAIQTISSAGTSQRQVPAAFKKIDWVHGQVNLDIGGGRYDDGTAYLAEQGVRNYVVDPWNRSLEHNVRALAAIDARGGADTVTLCNVLNVIAEPEIRRGVLQQAYDNLKPGGRCYISCYGGSLSRVGGRSTRGWQNNLPLGAYLEEVLSVFPDAYRQGAMIVAPKRFRP